MKITKIQLFYSCFFIFGFLSCNQKVNQKVEMANSSDSKMELDLLALQANNQLGKEFVVIVENDPVYHKTKKYKAVNAIELLQKEIDLTKIDVQKTKIVFECIDGYQPEMPLDLFLKSNAFLAFEDLDSAKGSKWEKIVKNGNEMDAQPFYLVYNAVSQKDNRYKWPYNLIKIQLKPINDAREALFPKGNNKVELGYNLFINQCITCHSLNGTGGKMGPELNFPKSVTSYWKEKELVDFIVNPSAFREHVKMPTLGISHQESQEIVAYLKFMATQKKETADRR